MRTALGAVVLVVLSATMAFAQGDGLGGVLTRDVPIPSDDDEFPRLLPAGGLVAFGGGRDWSTSYRKDGKVSVTFIIREEDEGLDRGTIMIPEDAVRVFTWACGEPIRSSLDPRHPTICLPFSSKYSDQWQLRFVDQGRKLAQELGLPLVEEFSPAYTGAPPSAQPAASATTGSPSKCTVDQILKMKEAGLSDSQIKAACG